MRKFRNASGSEGVECLEEVRRLPPATSTQGRCGAGGGIAAGATVGFPTNGAGNAGLALIWATWAVGAEGCGAANVVTGRFARGAATGSCEVAGMEAAGAAGRAVARGCEAAEWGS